MAVTNKEYKDQWLTMWYDNYFFTNSLKIILNMYYVVLKVLNWQKAFLKYRRKL